MNDYEILFDVSQTYGIPLRPRWYFSERSAEGFINSINSLYNGNFNGLHEYVANKVSYIENETVKNMVEYLICKRCGISKDVFIDAENINADSIEKIGIQVQETSKILLGTIEQDILTVVNGGMKNGRKIEESSSVQSAVQESYRRERDGNRYADRGSDIEKNKRYVRKKENGLSETVSNGEIQSNDSGRNVINASSQNIEGRMGDVRYSREQTREKVPPLTGDFIKDGKINREAMDTAESIVLKELIYTESTLIHSCSQ